MSNTGNRFPVVDSRVKILPEYQNKYPHNKGNVVSLTYIGQVPTACVQLDSGQFRWIPEKLLLPE